jgi:hypothetical protein
MELVLVESGNFKDISHFFHFVEMVFVALVEMNEKSLVPQDITRINIPHWSDPSWKGKGVKHNEWVVNRVFKNATVVHDPVYTPGALVVDRATQDKGAINKMWAKHIRRWDPWQWSRLLDLPAPQKKLPVVTYINRQNTRRRLSDADHTSIIKCLDNVDGIIFQSIVMENYSFEQQVEFMNETDLLLGVHGNGLTHAAFMKPHRAVCEIYPPGMPFQWDYYTLSKMMGHEYLCIFNGVAIPPCIFNDPGLREHPSCAGWSEMAAAPLVGIIKQIKEEK